MTDTITPSDALGGDDAPDDDGAASPSASGFRPYSDVEYVFEPHGATVPPVREYLQDAWDRRHFVVSMAKADLRGPRSRTRIGEIWAVADPLFQALIYWFIIVTIRRSSTGDTTGRLTILISGIFMFTLTSTILGSGGRSIVRNKSLMLNTQFPRILLPATEVYKGLLDLGPALAVYAVIHLLLGGPVGPGLFVVPLLIILQLLISTGLGLIFATLVVYIADMSNALDYVMRILFFTTPILYPVALLPSVAVKFLQINPFFALFACYQAVVTGGMPSAVYLLQATFWAGVLSVAGFRIFTSHERGFALRL